MRLEVRAKCMRSLTCLDRPQNKTVGIVGAGRIGAAYARMFAEGHKMDIVYYDPYPNKRLESYIAEYGKLLASKGERAVTIEQLPTVEDVLKRADVRSLTRCACQNTVAYILEIAWMCWCPRATAQLPWNHYC